MTTKNTKTTSKKTSRNNGARRVTEVAIEQPQIFEVALEITGTAPLLQNCFNQKALEQMLRKHMGLSTQKEPKVPADCIERATIRNEEGGVCIPSTAIKKAMLSAATLKKGLPKTRLRQQIFVEGNSIPIKYDRMEPQMDVVITSGIGRTPDIRFRPRFDGWSARLILSFAEGLAVQTVVDLLNCAGRVGVGEWRPEKDGTYGTFRVSRHIDLVDEIEEVRLAGMPYLKRLRIPDWAMSTELSADMLKKIGDGYKEVAA